MITDSVYCKSNIVIIIISFSSEFFFLLNLTKSVQTTTARPVSVTRLHQKPETPPQPVSQGSHSFPFPSPSQTMPPWGPLPPPPNKSSSSSLSSNSGFGVVANAPKKRPNAIISK